MKKEIIVAPSVLAADFGKMSEEVKSLENNGADWVHCDVMDGIFVPNISFGFKMINDIKKSTRLPLDVHLMIDRPERYLERFIDSGADIITFHVEATKNMVSSLEFLKKRRVRCGAVISPDTPVNALIEYLPICDIVLLMSVYPGFGGQKFIENSVHRLKELRALADKLNPEIDIEIDGGITEENVKYVIDAGANVIVAGSSVFKANDRKSAILALKQRF